MWLKLHSGEIEKKNKKKQRWNSTVMHAYLLLGTVNCQTKQVRAKNLGKCAQFPAIQVCSFISLWQISLT